MKIAVVGSGISGLSSAYLLSKKHEVDLYEKDSRLGGHARTTTIKDDSGKTLHVDTGFLVFNHATYPLLTKLFEELGVAIENSNMSFGFWDKGKDFAYNGNSLGGLFFQKKNLFNLQHYRMILDIIRFNKKANHDIMHNPIALDTSLGEYLKDFSDVFKERYLIAMGAAIWSTPNAQMFDFPAKTFIRFFKNHGLLGFNTQHPWKTVSGGSHNYVAKIAQKISGKIILDAAIRSVARSKEKVYISFEQGEVKEYDKIVFALHAPDALRLLSDASEAEKEILAAFSYIPNKAYLHTDNSKLYADRKIYCAWNYKANNDSEKATLSYWLNTLQNLDTKQDFFVSLNEDEATQQVIEKIAYEHPRFDTKAILMQGRKSEISGKNNTYYAGAYWRYGFHEDGIFSGNAIAEEFGCGL
ncbi:MAG: FAD-dependent oxidoreductase [Sulfurospirillum sp.]|nr:FAD-dependent oxidoreductase [Sulfurospirillum sp.]